MAHSDSTLVRTLNSSEMLDAADLSGAEAARTLEVNVSHGSLLRLKIDYVYGAATAISMTPYISYDGTNFTQYTTESYASGVGTISPLSRSRTGTASWGYNQDFDIRGAQKFKMVFAGSGSPTSSDTITTSGVTVVGF